jgi:hypothetical protein
MVIAYDNVVDSLPHQPIEERRMITHEENENIKNSDGNQHDGFDNSTGRRIVCTFSG